MTLTVDGGRGSQVNDVFAAADTEPVELGYATAEAQGMGCRFWGYASIVDNGTDGPATVPLLHEPL